MRSIYAAKPLKQWVKFFQALGVLSFLMLMGLEGNAQTQASSIIISPISGSTTSLRFDWTNGTSTTGRIVVIRFANSTWVPTNGVNYAATTAFPSDATTGTGPDFDAATGPIAAVVYNGTGSTATVNVTGLGANSSSNYVVQVYEYTGSFVYLNNTTTNNPVNLKYYLAGTPTWSVPSGIVKPFVQAWGGGGSGGGNSNNQDGGGGAGGGGYSEALVDVSADGGTINITVAASRSGNSGADGSAGNDSFFLSNTVLLAKGGGPGLETGGTGGAGGAGGPAGSGIVPVGGTKRSGGNGGNGRDNGTGRGGGSGSSAGTSGTAGNGGNGGGAVGTAGTAPTGGGAGSLGGDSDANGVAGNFPGGGGSGSGSDEGAGNRTGGAGAEGLVIVSYTNPTITSIVRQNPSGVNAPGPSVTFRVTFSEPVSGVSTDGSDFAISGAGATGATISGLVNNSTTEADITVSSISNAGTLSLDLAGGQNIISVSTSNALLNFIATEQDYTIQPFATSPAAQPTGISFTNITTTSMRVNYSAAGDGSARVLVAKSGTAVSVDPIDGTTYSPTGNFTTDTDLGSGNIVVGKITSIAAGFFDVTNLSANTTYHFAIYELNGTGGTENYFTTGPLTGNRATLAAEPTAQATALVFSNVGTTAMDVGFTAATGSPAGYLVVRRTAASPTGTPVDGTGYLVNDALGDGTVEFVGAIGSIPFNDASLTAGTVYHYDVFAYNGAGASINYFTTSPLEGSRTTLSASPASQPATMTFSSITSTSITVNYGTAGDGTARVLVAKSGTAVNVDPIDGTTYSPTGNFTTDTNLGSGNIVVGKVTSTAAGSFVVNNLSPNTTYHFAIYELNGSAGSENYFTTAPLIGNRATLASEPTAQATAMVFTSITSTSMNVGFTAATGNPDGYIVLRRTTTSPTGSPVDGTIYNVNDVLGDGTVEFVGAIGSIPFNDASLTAATVYQYDVFAYNGAGASINYYTTAPLEGSQTTVAAVPTAQPTGLTFSSVTATTMTVNYAAAGDGTARILVAKAGSAVSANPVNGATYAPNGNYGTPAVGTDLGSGNIVVGLVTSTTAGSFPVTGLTSGTTYHFAVFEFNGSGGTQNYNTTGPLAGSQITRPAIVSVTSDATGAGVLKIGQTITFTVDIETTEAGLTIAPTTYNGGTLTWGTVNGGNTYTATYTVTAGHTDQTSALQLTGVTATNTAGASASANGADVVKTIDANVPVISAVAIPDVAMNVGDNVPVTITVADDGGQTYSLVSGTINGFTVGSFARTNSTTYTASFTVTNGGTDRAIGDNIPVNIIIQDPATNPSLAFTTAIAQGNDLIDANRPTLVINRNAVTLGSFTGTTDNSISFTLAFNEVMNSGSITLADITVNHGGTTASSGNTITNLSADNQNFVVTLNSVTGNGTITITVAATVSDAAGNDMAALVGPSLGIVIDNTPPVAPSAPDLAAADDTGFSNTDNITKNTSALTLSGTSEANASIEIFEGAISRGTTTANGSGNWTIDITLTAGTHNTFTADIIDASGNPGPASTALASIVVDTTPPSVSGSITFNPNAGPANAETLTFAFSETVTNITNGAGGAVDFAMQGFASIGRNAVGSQSYTNSTTSGTLVSSATNSDWSGTMSISYTTAPTGNIFDIAGNAMATAASISASDSQAPVLVTGMVFNPNGSGPETITFNLSESLVLANNSAVLGFTVFNPTTTSTYIIDNVMTGNGLYSGQGSTETITLTSMADGQWDEFSQVSYDQPSGNVQDPSNNELGTITNEPILLHSIEIESNNTNTILAKPGDVISVRFTTTRVLTGSSVTVFGAAATQDGTVTAPNYKFDYTLTGTEANGNVPFVITANEAAKTTLTSVTTDGSAVTFDKTAPTITPVSIISDNAILTSYAGPGGQKITVTFTANEPINTSISTGTIGGLTASFNLVAGLVYEATVTTTSAIPTGTVAFSLTARDQSGNPTTFTATTDASSVTFDKTAPFVNTVAIASSVLGFGANGTTSTTVDYTVTFNEPVQVSSVTADDFTVTGIAATVPAQNPTGLPADATATGVVSNIVAVSPSGGLATAYTVTVNTITGKGFLRLDLDPANTLIDRGSNDNTASFTTGSTYSIVHPEPTNHVTASGGTFTAPSSTSSTITLTWSIPPVGSQAATHWLILAKEAAASFPAVADGTYIADNNDYTDGVGSLNVLHNFAGPTGTAVMTGLNSGTAYSFLIYPYALSGKNSIGNINFRTAATVPTASASTGTGSANNITAGTASAPATIGSITGTSLTKVFTFKLKDDGSNNVADNAKTRINQIIIKAGAGNTVTNWADVIASADLNTLTESDLTAVTNAAVGTNTITFPLSFNDNDLGELDDNEQKEYELRIALKTSMTNGANTTIDNLSFDFRVDDGSFSYETGSSTFGLLDPTPGASYNSSATGANTVIVNATELNFTTSPPSSALVLANLTTTPVVTAQDANGNTDKNYTSTLTISNGGSFTMSQSTLTGASGVYTFPLTFQYTHGGNGTATNNAALTLSGPDGVVAGVASNPAVSGNISLNYTNTATITAGSLSEPVTVASTNTGTGSGAALSVFDFTVTDDNSVVASTDGAPIRINSIVIGQGGSNTVTNWTDAINEAYLTDGTNTVSGTIAASTITFSGLTPTSATTHIGYIDDYLSAAVGSKTYTLKINLKGPMTGNQDNRRLHFILNQATANRINIQTSGAPLQSSYIGGSETEDSGAGNNLIDVDITHLSFTQDFVPLVDATPSNYFLTDKNINLQQTPVPVIKALDAVGNIDLDYNNQINLSIGASALINTASLNTDNAAPNAGVYTFPNGFQFTQSSTATTNVTATTTGGGPIYSVSSASFNVRGGKSVEISGSNNSTAIPSIADTQAEKVDVLSFTIKDEFTGVTAAENDGSDTQIKTLVISSAGAGNQVTDWSQAIGGVMLSDNAASPTTTSAVIGTNSITFNLSALNAAGQIGNIPDNGTKVYTLSIWLKSDLSGTNDYKNTIDGLDFAFQVNSVSQGTIDDGTGTTSLFRASPTSASGTSANDVDVDASIINYTTQPITASIGVDIGTNAIIVKAQDSNGNTDTSYNGTINFTSAPNDANGLGNTSDFQTTNLPPGPFVSGVLAYPSTFQFLDGNGNTQLTIFGNTSGNGQTIGGTSANINVISSFESALVGDPSFSPPLINGIPYKDFQEATDLTFATSYELTRGLLIDGSRSSSFTYGGFPLSGYTNTDTEGTPIDGVGDNTDADGAPTRLASITLRITNPSAIRRIELYSGASPIAGTELNYTGFPAIQPGILQTGGLPYIDFTWTDPTALITATNDSQTPLSVRVSFRDSSPEVVDNYDMRVQLIAATEGQGSKFFIGAGFIAGQPPQTLANSVGKIAVVATSLDFESPSPSFGDSQPSAIAGIDEPIAGIVDATGRNTTSPGGFTGIVYARDKFGLLDEDFSFTVDNISADALPYNYPPNFSSGVLDLDSIRYAQPGDGTLVVESKGLVSNIQPSDDIGNWTQGNLVDVINVTADNYTKTQVVGGDNMNDVSLKSGVKAKTIFGFEIYAQRETSSEPNLTSFSIIFRDKANGGIPYPYKNGPQYGTIFENLKIGVDEDGVYRTLAPADYSITEDQTAALKALVGINTSPKDKITVTLTSAFRLYNRNIAKTRFFLIVDVSLNAKGSTKPITPYLIDNGYGKITNSHITTTSGSSSSNVEGKTFKFATTKPPVLVSTIPFNGQLNVDPRIDTIFMTFDVPVVTFDGKITIHERSTGDSVTTFYQVPHPYAINVAGGSGDYTWNSSAPLVHALQGTDLPKAHVASLLAFKNPGYVFAKDSVYFVTVAKGRFSNLDMSDRAGISDEDFNLFGGISFNGTFYFKASTRSAPSLINTLPGSYFYSQTTASFNLEFDKKGKLNYMVVEEALDGLGTISVVSTTVTGVGTNFLSDLQGGISGSTLYTPAGVKIGEIQSVGSNTTATLKTAAPANYSGAYKFSVNLALTSVSNSQVKGLTNYLASNVVYRDSLDITTVTPNSQWVTFPRDLVTSTGSNPFRYRVYVTAKNDAQPDSLLRTTSSPYESNLLPDVDGTADTQTTILQKTNGRTQTHGLAQYEICPNSFVRLDDPIVISEINTVSGRGYFAGAYGLTVQRFNILLPNDIIYDITKLPTVTLSSTSDFGYAQPTAHAKFISASLLEISYVNTGSTSADYIILSDIYVKALTSTASGNIVRFYGNGLDFVPSYDPTNLNNGSAFGTISTTPEDPLPFTNEYSNDPRNAFPSFWNSVNAGQGELISPETIVTYIPDNYADVIKLNPPFIKNDYGINIFSGNGVTNDELTLSAVEKDAAFNISYEHTNQIGCNSTTDVQYLVYDHKQSIPALLKIPTNPNPLIPDSVRYDIRQATSFSENPRIGLRPGAPDPLTNIPGKPRKTLVLADSISYLSSAGYRLLDLKASLPKIPKGSILEKQPGWANIVANIPRICTNCSLGGIHSEGLRNYRTFNWEYSDLINETTATANGLTYPYALSQTLFWGLTPQNRNYFNAGYLGTVEFTGAYQSTADNTVFIPFRQEVDIYLPAIPVIEVDGESARLGWDGVNTNIPFTPVYCNNGNTFNITAYPNPSVSSVSASMYFILRDSAGVVLRDPRSSNVAIQNIAGFTDNGNGTATFDPTVITNNFETIEIEYVYQQEGSPAVGASKRYIRVTPAPVASFARTSDLSLAQAVHVGRPNTLNDFCEDNWITFMNTSTINDPIDPNNQANLNLRWTFNTLTPQVDSTTRFRRLQIPVFPLDTVTVPVDVSSIGLYHSSNGTWSQVTERLKDNIRFIYNTYGSNPISLKVSSKYNCESNVATGTVVVGAIPTPSFTMTGLTSTLNVTETSTVNSGNGAVSTIDNAQTSYLVIKDALVEDLNTSEFDYITPDPKLETFASTLPSFLPGHFNVIIRTVSNLGCEKTSHRHVIMLPPAAPDSDNPYINDFESNNGFWQTGLDSVNVNGAVNKASGSSWKLGTPTKSTITANTLTGNNVWATGLTSAPPAQERSFLYTPVFSLTDLDRPMITFNSAYNFNNGSDGVVLQYSTDDRNVADPLKVWNVIGAQGTGLGWFDKTNIGSNPGDGTFPPSPDDLEDKKFYGWSSTSPVPWQSSRHTLLDFLDNAPQVVFRFALATSSESSGGEGFGLDNFRLGNRTRTVLIENFANNSNTGTEDSERTFLGNVDEGIDVVKLNYHTNFPGADVFNQRNPEDPSGRALYYGVTETPKARMDGFKFETETKPYLSQWYESEFAIRSLDLSQALLQLTANTTPEDGYSVTVNVKAVTELPANTILHVAFAEGVNNGLTLTGDTRPFEYIVRKMLPSASGTKFGTIVTAGSSEPFGPYNWLPSGSDLFTPTNDMMVIAFLQNEITKEVYQAIMTPLPLEDPSVVTAIENPFNLEDIKIFPNPADKELNIVFPVELKNDVPLVLYDQVGRPTKSIVAKKGAQSITLDTSNEAAGMYILQLDLTETKRERTKVIITH